MDITELAAKGKLGFYVTRVHTTDCARLKSSDNKSDLQKKPEVGNYRVFLLIRNQVFSGILAGKLREMPINTTGS